MDRLASAALRAAAPYGRALRREGRILLRCAGRELRALARDLLRGFARELLALSGLSALVAPASRAPKARRSGRR